MLKIHISNIKEGEHEYEFKIGKNDIDLSGIDDIKLKDDVTVRAVLYKTGNQFDLKSIISGTFLLQCDRCLDEYEYKFENTFEIIYKYDYASERNNIEDEEDDIKLIAPKTGFIDISEDVRDYILLSVPLKKAPEEIDGRCIYCKKNISELLEIQRQEEINPVWEKLIKQKTKK